MRKIRMLLMTSILVILGLTGFMTKVVMADQGLTSQQSNQVSLNLTATLQSQKPILDIAVQMTPELAKGGQIQIDLLDSNDRVQNTITYDLQAGWTQMTAWFDLTGRPSGNYSVKVTYNGQSQQTGPLHFDLN